MYNQRTGVGSYGLATGYYCTQLLNFLFCSVRFVISKGHFLSWVIQQICTESVRNSASAWLKICRRRECKSVNMNTEKLVLVFNLAQLLLLTGLYCYLEAEDCAFWGEVSCGNAHKACFFSWRALLCCQWAVEEWDQSLQSITSQAETHGWAIFTWHEDPFNNHCLWVYYCTGFVTLF